MSDTSVQAVLGANQDPGDVPDAAEFEKARQVSLTQRKRSLPLERRPASTTQPTTLRQCTRWGSGHSLMRSRQLVGPSLTTTISPSS